MGDTQLLTPPERLAEARQYGLPTIHMAFRLGADGRIHHPALPGGVRGGWMLLGVPEGPPGGTDPRRAVQDVLMLCAQRGFGGVMLDVEPPPTPYLARLIALLDESLARRGLGLMLPEAYANYAQRAKLCLSSAISGGSLRRRLEGAVQRYGAGRIALCLRRVREDFYLPAPEGRGAPLTEEELQALIARLDPAVFFSPELCAHYFTYMSRTTGAHFVLFDDGQSLRRKRALARELGIGTILLLLPESADVLGEALAER